jgi:hypothetical protein
MTWEEVEAMSQVRPTSGAREGTAGSRQLPAGEGGAALERTRQDHLAEWAGSQRPAAPGPLEMTRNLGWALTIVGAVGSLTASWALFPMDAEGMWAGYWVSGCSTTAILGAMLLRSSLPTALGVALTAIPGGVLLLFGALRDYTTTISVTMMVGGAAIVLGALMQADRHGRAAS